MAGLERPPEEPPQRSQSGVDRSGRLSMGELSAVRPHVVTGSAEQVGFVLLGEPRCEPLQVGQVQSCGAFGHRRFRRQVDQERPQRVIGRKNRSFDELGGTTRTGAGSSASGIQGGSLRHRSSDKRCYRTIRSSVVVQRRWRYWGAEGDVEE